MRAELEGAWSPAGRSGEWVFLAAVLMWCGCVSVVQYRCIGDKRGARGMEGLRDRGDQSMKCLLGPAGRSCLAAFVFDSIRNGEPLNRFS